MYLISKKTWFIAESPESSFSHSLPLPRPSPSSHLCHHDQYSKYLQWLQKSPYALLEGFPSPGSIRSSVSADSVCPGSREKMMGMGLDQTHLPCLALRLSISASSELLLKQGQTLMTIHLIMTIHRASFFTVFLLLPPLSTNPFYSFCYIPGARQEYFGSPYHQWSGIYRLVLAQAIFFQNNLSILLLALPFILSLYGDTL